MKSVYSIILAAGLGKRMKSKLPKVLHHVGGITLLEHAMRLALQIKSKGVFIVVPKNHQDFHACLEAMPSQKNKFRFVVQTQQLGTGHAVKCALDHIKDKEADLVILNADMPLIEGKSIRGFYSAYKRAKAKVSVLTAVVEKPFGFGRIIRDKKDSLLEIVEEKDATSTERKIREVSSGSYVYDLKFLKKFIGKMKIQNKQKEYYLPDLVKIARKAGYKATASIMNNAYEAMGISSQEDLNRVNRFFYKLQCEKYAREGVRILGEDVFIDAGVKIGRGTSLEAPCFVKGNTKIAGGVVIETGAVIKSSQIAKSALIKAHCYIDQSKVGELCQVGPFAHLRPLAKLEAKAKAGNFVEVKKSTIGQGSKVNHLTYIGDAKIGKAVNVGAGTITCNYDGKNKFKTVLEDGVFIGSNTELVAPVKIGKNAVVGAGTTVTKDVKSNSLVISRVYQKEVQNWAKKRQ